MSRFESGVARYIRGVAVVENYFPVDFKGNASINCYQCKFFRRASSSCALNNAVCEFPDKYVSGNCPLERMDDDEGDPAADPG